MTMKNPLFKKKDKEKLAEDNYLVTKAVNTSLLPEEKKNEDFEMLAKAEEKVNYRTNIAKSIKNPQIARAVSALQVKNPFKGV